MNKTLTQFTFLAASFIIVLMPPAFAQKSGNLPSVKGNYTTADFLPGTLIIRVKPDHRAVSGEHSIQDPKLAAALQEIGTTQLFKIFPGKTPPAQATNEFGQKYADLSLIYEVLFQSSLSVEAAARHLYATGVLLYAEPKFLPRTHYTPNDPSLGLQSFLGKIQAYSAWDISKGDTTVVIGITDTGTDTNHPDLQNNIQLNYNDPINGTDDDNDGYTDNYAGWDLGENDNNPSVNVDPHGSHVSGCAAAVTDNGTGVASPGFNTRFLPVKIANASGSLTKAYEGIVYAADHGCAIINCSWGGPGGGTFGQDVVNYATVNMNALVVASAGNNGVQSDLYPAAFNYVIGVASTTNNDNKSSFSNYGGFVDVCAPGSNIYSTFYNNIYSSQSGTSMSAPIASGAAALIKAVNPGFNALQIGEQLRVTCDNIYGIPTNAAYIDKLGKGRINMFRSLTESSPSVRMENRVITDNNDDAFVINDTLFITGDFMNYLAPTTNLVVTLTTSSGYVTSIDNSTTLGAIGTMASQNNLSDPFVYKINPGTPQNTKIVFKVNYTDGSYTDFQTFEVVVNVDYINITINDVATTITSKGRIGYNDEAQLEGLGFRYNNENLLYEAGLMIGVSTAKVSDNVRGTGATPENDYQSVQVVQKVLPSVASDFDLYGKFNDVLSTSPLPVLVTHKAYAWSTPGDRKYVIVDYTISNSGVQTLSGLFAGIFADWDIQTYSDNMINEDLTTKMGYAYNTGTGGLWAGIKLLTSGPFVHYGIDNVAGQGGVNMTDGYNTAEKYTTLSTNRATAGGPPTGNDVIDVVSSGPFILAPGDSVTVAFALIAGDDLQDIITSANNAQIKYDNISTGVADIENDLQDVVLYPNPAKDILRIYTDKLRGADVTVYDITGRVVSHFRLIDQTTELQISKLAPGVYDVAVSDGRQNLHLKFVKN